MNLHIKKSLKSSFQFQKRHHVSIQTEIEIQQYNPVVHIITRSTLTEVTHSALCCVLSGEATYTNLIVFGLIRPVLEPTIYHTRGKHANHYVIDAVTTYEIVKENIINFY
jgi:exonuclease I